MSRKNDDYRGVLILILMIIGGAILGASVVFIFREQITDLILAN